MVWWCLSLRANLTVTPSLQWHLFLQTCRWAVKFSITLSFCSVPLLSAFRISSLVRHRICQLELNIRHTRTHTMQCHCIFVNNAMEFLFFNYFCLLLNDEINCIQCQDKNITHGLFSLGAKSWRYRINYGNKQKLPVQQYQRTGQ